jgi:ATP phosphoribosyltransferase
VEQTFKDRGQRIEIIKLGGSVELAPLMGLSDVIVDIVETGSTLRDNGLVILEELDPISARLIVNKVSYRFKYAAIQKIQKILGGI